MEKVIFSKEFWRLFSLWFVPLSLLIFFVNSLTLFDGQTDKIAKDLFVAQITTFVLFYSFIQFSFTNFEVPKDLIRKYILEKSETISFVAQNLSFILVQLIIVICQNEASSVFSNSYSAIILVFGVYSSLNYLFWLSKFITTGNFIELIIKKLDIKDFIHAETVLNSKIKIITPNEDGQIKVTTSSLLRELFTIDDGVNLFAKNSGVLISVNLDALTTNIRTWLGKHKLEHCLINFLINAGEFVQIKTPLIHISIPMSKIQRKELQPAFEKLELEKYFNYEKFEIDNTWKQLFYDLVRVMFEGNFKIKGHDDLVLMKNFQNLLEQLQNESLKNKQLIFIEAQFVNFIDQLSLKTQDIEIIDRNINLILEIIQRLNRLVIPFNFIQIHEAINKLQTLLFIRILFSISTNYQYALKICYYQSALNLGFISNENEHKISLDFYKSQVDLYWRYSLKILKKIVSLYDINNRSQWNAVLVSNLNTFNESIEHHKSFDFLKTPFCNVKDQMDEYSEQFKIKIGICIQLFEKMLKGKADTNLFNVLVFPLITPLALDPVEFKISETCLERFFELPLHSFDYYCDIGDPHDSIKILDRSQNLNVYYVQFWIVILMKLKSIEDNIYNFGEGSIYQQERYFELIIESLKKIIINLKMPKSVAQNIPNDIIFKLSGLEANRGDGYKEEIINLIFQDNIESRQTSLPKI